MKNSMPPHFVLHKSKEVIFYIPNGMPTTMGIPMAIQMDPKVYSKQIYGLWYKQQQYK